MARPSPQTERVTALIAVLAERPGAALTLAEVTRRLGVNKSTCHSMLTALLEAGWLLRDPVRKAYRLGPAVAAAGRVAAAGLPALDFAHPVMVDLSVGLGASCAALGVGDDRLTVLDHVRDPRAPGGALRVGSHVPLVAPFGAVVIAHAGDAAARHWLSGLPADRHAHHRRALAAIRERGYAAELSTTPEARLKEAMARLEPGAGATADPLPVLLERLAGELAGEEDFFALAVDPDREYTLSALNAPVFDHDGAVTLVLALTDFPGRLTGAALEAAGTRLAGAAAGLTTSLRGRAPAVRPAATP